MRSLLQLLLTLNVNMMACPSQREVCYHSSKEGLLPLRPITQNCRIRINKTSEPVQRVPNSKNIPMARVFISQLSTFRHAIYALS
jgi:hypothetical protein